MIRQINFISKKYNQIYSVLTERIPLISSFDYSMEILTEILINNNSIQQLVNNTFITTSALTCNLSKNTDLNNKLP